MDEQLLLNNLQRGDKAAYEYLYEEYYTGLVVFATRLLKDSDLAGETVQGVFVHLYEKRQEIHIHTSLQAHLYQSVKNRCLNIFKKEQTHRIHHEQIANGMSEAQYVEDELYRVELEDRIYKEIKKLPDQCRKIFEMSRFEGVSNAEIAEDLKISKRTVETQISKALKRLRGELKDVLQANLTLVPILIFWLLFERWL